MTEIGGNSAGLVIAIPDSSATVTLAWGLATDTGRRRAANEDSVLAVSPVFAVADGMGGHSAGDLASAAVVQRLADAAEADFLDPRAIDRALEEATGDIAAIAAESELGVGTTVTGAALTLQDGEPYFTVFNIGDSRVYVFERNELAQVTVDHSVVQELVEAGAITHDQAEEHPDSNVITRAVGFNATPRADYWTLPLRSGMRLLLCSDGLTKELRHERTRLHLAAGMTAAETASALVDAAVAAGGRDNITTIVIDVLDSPAPHLLEDTAPRST